MVSCNTNKSKDQGRDVINLKEEGWEKTGKLSPDVGDVEDVLPECQQDTIKVAYSNYF